MSRILAVLVALTISFVLIGGGSHNLEGRGRWLSGDGYDWWADCSELPDAFELLPTYLGSEAPGLVDLGKIVTRDGMRSRAVQYTRDKDLGPTRVNAGRWYGGMGAEEWPSHTVDVAQQLDALRVTSWQIDGNQHIVDPACVLTFATDDLALGLYNVWVRFPEPGFHTLKITARQVREFFFVYPFARMGTADPSGLDGRRVFLRGEAVGDVLDGEFVHTYELHVGREQP